MQRVAFTLIALLALSGCATREVYVVPELPLPEPPVLPVVFAPELACLSDETYEALAVRDARRKGTIGGTDVLMC